MEHEIYYGPAYAMAVIRMQAGESLVAEAGVMASMSPGIEMKTDSKGGFMKGLARAALGGESFFMNTYSAVSESEICIAPNSPGDVQHWELKGETIMVTSGCYLCNDGGITVDTKWGGAKTFFSSEGLFLLKVSGAGNLWISAYGALRRIDLQPGQQYIVDTGHMVAFAETVQYQVEKVGGWKSTILGGEGLIVRLTGPGPIWMQTRNPNGLAAWLYPLLPKTSA